MNKIIEVIAIKDGSTNNFTAFVKDDPDTVVHLTVYDNELPLGPIKEMEVIHGKLYTNNAASKEKQFFNANL